jgi:hypothetical protein
VNLLRAPSGSLIALVLLSLCLSACGGGESPASNEPSDSEPSVDNEVVGPAPHPDEVPIPHGKDPPGREVEPADPTLPPSSTTSSGDDVNEVPDSGTDPAHTDEAPVTDGAPVGRSGADGNNESNATDGHSTEEDRATDGAPVVGTGAEGDKKSEATDERIIVVGGPTLNNDYPEYWGNLYLGDQCANFTIRSKYTVTLESVTVEDPLSLITDCDPDWGEEVTSRGCESDIVFSSGTEAHCLLGVQLPDDGLDTDFTPTNTWTFSVLCSDTDEPPCSEVDNEKQHLLSEDGVRVYWTVEYPMRWCGASDYGPLDEEGEPAGPGESPVHGCVGPSSAAN